MTDSYQVLGVSKDASADTIKKAFRKLAKQYHPDATGGDEGAKQKFVEINQAYETLSNPDKRRKYDAEKETPFSNFGGGNRASYEYATSGMDFDDLLGSFFSGRTATHTYPPQSLDVMSQCDITPWVAALGGRMDVRVGDKTLSIKIPPESKGGQKLRLRGQGLHAGGKTGDLLIELILQNPTHITPEMKHLYERMAALP